MEDETPGGKRPQDVGDSLECVLQATGNQPVVLNKKVVLQLASLIDQNLLHNTV